MAEADIRSPQTVVDWFNLCRKNIYRFLNWKATKIGGIDNKEQAIVVEIFNQSIFIENTSRARLSGDWVVVGLERNS